MKPLDAEDRLLELLASRGTTLVREGHDWVGSGTEARAAWEAFGAVATEPLTEEFTNHRGETLRIDRTEDGDLLVFVAWRPRDRPVFCLSFSREFSFADDEGYAGMNALHLEVEFAAADALDAFDQPPRGAGELRRPFREALDWIEEVEAHPAFVRAFDHHAPARFTVAQNDV